MRHVPLAFLLVASCDSPPPAAPQAAAPPAPFLCAQARKGLEQVAAKGMIEYDRSGQATVPENVWMRLRAEGRDRFARTLALHAACNAPGGPAERQVVIRNEFGRVMMDSMLPGNAGADLLPAEGAAEELQP